MAQIAEAYIHFKPYSINSRKADALGKYAEKLAVQAASEIFGGDVLVHIEMEEGSLKTRMAVATIAGLAIYGHVADYKGSKRALGKCAQMPANSRWMFVLRSVKKPAWKSTTSIVLSGD